MSRRTALLFIILAAVVAQTVAQARWQGPGDARAVWAGPQTVLLSWSQHSGANRVIVQRCNPAACLLLDSRPSADGQHTIIDDQRPRAGDWYFIAEFYAHAGGALDIGDLRGPVRVPYEQRFPLMAR